MPGRSPVVWAVTRAARLARRADRLGCDPAEAIERDRHARLTRREALAAGLGLGLGLGLHAAPARAAAVADADRPERRGGPRVVVVGAGIAGLVVASELKKAGVRAEVYEADRRTGGRVFSAAGLMAPGVVTELGGEFVNSDHDALLGLVRAFGLELVDMAADPDPALAREAYVFGGVHRTPAEVVAAFRPFARDVAEDCDDVGDPGEFPHTAEARALDRWSVAEYLDDLGVKSGWLRALLDAAVTAEFGLDPGEVSALSFLTLMADALGGDGFRASGGSDERYKVRGGSGAVTGALAGRVADRLHLGHRLVSVRRRAAGGFVLAFAGPGAASREVAADLVVLAVPFSVLRSVELKTGLSPRQRRAIDGLGYGTNAKLLAGFRSRPWRAGGYRGTAVSDEPFQVAWDGSRLQNAPGGPGVLTLYLGGRAGRDAGAGTADERVAALLPGVDRAFPGAAAAHDGRAERFHWPTAPFALGSYGCFKPGQWTALAGALGRPAGDLHFAGEHCLPSEPGYMNSAAASGLRTARAVLTRVERG